jgi:hypothetical protein
MNTSTRILALSLIAFLVSALASCGNIFEYNKYDPESYQYPWFSEANLVEKSSGGQVIREMPAVVDNGTVNSFGISTKGLLTCTLDPACSGDSTYALKLHGVFGLRFAVWSDSSTKISVPEEMIAFDEAGFILKEIAPAWHIASSGGTRTLSCSIEVSNDGPLSRTLVFDVTCSK